PDFFKYPSDKIERFRDVQLDVASINEAKRMLLQLLLCLNGRYSSKDVGIGALNLVYGMKGFSMKEQVKQNWTTTMYKRLFCAIGHVKSRMGRSPVPKWAQWFARSLDKGAAEPDEPDAETAEPAAGPAEPAAGPADDFDDDSDDAPVMKRPAMKRPAAADDPVLKKPAAAVGDGDDAEEIKGTTARPATIEKQEIETTIDEESRPVVKRKQQHIDEIPDSIFRSMDFDDGPEAAPPVTPDPKPKKVKQDPEAPRCSPPPAPATSTPPTATGSTLQEQPGARVAAGAVTAEPEQIEPTYEIGWDENRLEAWSRKLRARGKPYAAEFSDTLQAFDDGAVWAKFGSCGWKKIDALKPGDLQFIEAKRKEKLQKCKGKARDACQSGVHPKDKNEIEVKKYKDRKWMFKLQYTKSKQQIMMISIDEKQGLPEKMAQKVIIQLAARFEAGEIEQEDLYAERD
ncbi:unnamed protein product, partial [Prorocentrum cordatum]